MTTENNPEAWAIVELMGHVSMAGRVTKPGEYGGLWQIDIPTGDSFRTEFFGSQSVYRIRMVSEEIARVYAPRDEHQQVVERYQNRINELLSTINTLRLPAGGELDIDGDQYEEFDEEEGYEGDPPF